MRSSPKRISAVPSHPYCGKRPRFEASPRVPLLPLRGSATPLSLDSPFADHPVSVNGVDGEPRYEQCAFILLATRTGITFHGRRRRRGDVVRETLGQRERRQDERVKVKVSRFSTERVLRARHTRIWRVERVMRRDKLVSRYRSLRVRSAACSPPSLFT